MSFIGSSDGIGFAAGRFLANDEICTRETVTVPADHPQVVTNPDNSKYVPDGAIIEGVGILYEPINVSKGAALGSVVTAGTVYADKLPKAPTAEQKAALAGITFIDESPAITRPY